MAVSYPGIAGIGWGRNLRYPILKCRIFSQSLSKEGLSGENFCAMMKVFQCEDRREFTVFESAAAVSCVRADL